MKLLIIKKFMTGEEIIDLANYLIGEEVFDDTSAPDLIFLNTKKDSIESEYEFEFLKTKATLTSNDLPTDFLMPLGKNSLYIGVIPYNQISLADSIGNTGMNFYIDYTTSKIYLADSTSIVGAILNYIKKTDDITNTSSPVWPKCQEIISYDMSIEYLEGLDYDPINEAKAEKLRTARTKLFNNLININSKMALTSMGMSLNTDLGSLNTDGKVDIYG